MEEDRRSRSSLVNALWGAGIDLPAPTREHWRAARPMLALQVALTVCPAIAIWIVIGVWTGAWGWGGGAAAAVFVATSTTFTIAVVRREGRGGYNSPRSDRSK